MENEIKIEVMTEILKEGMKRYKAAVYAIAYCSALALIAGFIIGRAYGAC